MKKVQRLNGNGCLLFKNNECLRYSLLPRLNPSKYTERWGIKVPTPTKHNSIKIKNYKYPIKFKLNHYNMI